MGTLASHRGATPGKKILGLPEGPAPRHVSIHWGLWQRPCCQGSPSGRPFVLPALPSPSSTCCLFGCHLNPLSLAATRSPPWKPGGGCSCSCSAPGPHRGSATAPATAAGVSPPSSPPFCHFPQRRAAYSKPDGRLHSSAAAAGPPHLGTKALQAFVQPSVSF